MESSNPEYMNQLADLKRQIASKDAIISEKAEQLQRIYQMKSWRISLGLVRIKKQLKIIIKRIFGFFILIFLTIFTVIITLYLVLLKKVRKSMVFPGG